MNIKGCHKLLLVLWLVFGLWFFLGGCASKVNGPRLVTLENGQHAYQIIGRVDRISTTNQEITLKPLSGNPVTVGYSDFTRLLFLSSSSQITKEMVLKVFFVFDSDNKEMALIIERLPKGG